MSRERNEHEQTSPTDDGYIARFFKDVGTQVEESDLVQPQFVRTGVAETAPVVSYSQVFGTASLNTEPQITFVLPSLKSAFRRQGNFAEDASRSDPSDMVTSSAGLNSAVSSKCSEVSNNKFTTKDRPSNDQQTSSSTSHSAGCSILPSLMSPPLTSLPQTSQASPSLTSPSSTSQPLTLPRLTSPLLTSPSFSSPSSTSSRPVFPSRPPNDYRSEIMPTSHQTSSVPRENITPRGQTHLTSPVITSSRATAPNTLDNTTLLTRPKSTTINVVSGVSRQVHHQLRLSGYPQVYTPTPVQSELTRGAVTSLGTSTCAVTTTNRQEPGSPLQTSEKFLLKVSGDARSFHVSPYTSTPRDQTHDETSSSERSKTERVSTSRNSAELTWHEQHPLQLMGQESALNECNSGMTSSENPLTRRRASSAPSVGLEFFGRLFRRALLTNNCPEQVDVGLPPQRTSPETSNAVVQTAEMETEHAQSGASSSKRRRSSVGTGKERKRRKSVAFVDQDERDSRLRDKLHQRVWDGTTFKVEEVDDIDFTEIALSRRGSRRESMGIVGNPSGSRSSSPVQGSRRRHSSAVHNARGTIDSEQRTGSLSPRDVMSRLQQSLEIGESSRQASSSYRTEERSGESTQQASASHRTDERSGEQSSAGRSRSQNETTLKNAISGDNSTTNSKDHSGDDSKN